MEKRLFLGVDGGQTSTLAALCDETGRLLGVGRAGPSNHIHEPGGMERMETALRTSTQAAFAQAGWHGEAAELPELSAACCGMTGGVEAAQQLFPRAARTQTLRIETDLVTAHAGALAGAPGVIVIAGTGSVAYGVNPQGETARAGGWAYIMGDEGSAYDLGRRALVAAARAVDGRGPETTLLPAIISHFRKSSLWEVRSLVYEGKIDRAGIAQLARLVVQAAQGGDPAASALLEEGALALSEIAWAVLARLKLDKGETPVVPVGGLFQAGSLLWDPFSIYLRKRAPRVRIVSPLYQPVIGALLLAFKAGGLAIDAPLHDQLRLADQQLGSKEGSTP